MIGRVLAVWFAYMCGERAEELVEVLPGVLDSMGHEGRL